MMKIASALSVLLMAASSVSAKKVRHPSKGGSSSGGKRGSVVKEAKFEPLFPKPLCSPFSDAADPSGTIDDVNFIAGDERAVGDRFFVDRPVFSGYNPKTGMCSGKVVGRRWGECTIVGNLPGELDNAQCMYTTQLFDFWDAQITVAGIVTFGTLVGNGHTSPIVGANAGELAGISGHNRVIIGAGPDGSDAVDLINYMIKQKH